MRMRRRALFPKRHLRVCVLNVTLNDASLCFTTEFCRFKGLQNHLQEYGQLSSQSTTSCAHRTGTHRHDTTRQDPNRSDTTYRSKISTMKNRMQRMRVVSDERHQRGRWVRQFDTLHCFLRACVAAQVRVVQHPGYGEHQRANHQQVAILRHLSCAPPENVLVKFATSETESLIAQSLSTENTTR